MTENRITCDACDDLLSEYLEGDLDEVRSAPVTEHLATCARCQGLLRDIDAITTEASSLPELAPSSDLWQSIESRIAPAVVPISKLHRSRGLSSRMLGLAAAFLIVVSSSITYVATRTLDTTKKPVRVADAPRPVPASGVSDEIGSSSSGKELPSASVQSEHTAGEAPSQARAGEKQSQRVETRSGRSTALASASNAPLSASEISLAPEIARLQVILHQRRQDLDPSTVKIVEENLRIIDAAVKQSRAALAKDPASGFLTEQLDDMLQKKVQLLRTAALLPSRS
jgi:anti-sigma factor RsiW